MPVPLSSLAEQVGQLFLVGFHGTSPSPEIRAMLQDHHVGGVILFARNIRDGAHVTELTAALQALAERPLFFAADQEGGSVLRVRDGASQLPSAMGLGRLGVEAAEAVGRMAGSELRAMGLNLNLAPVLDVNDPANPGIGIRALGEDAEAVATLGAAYIRGLQATGALACAKHFPGTGAARLDAHLDLPVIDAEIDTLRERELAPFRAAFDAGVAAVLTSHCVYPALDDQPATLSPGVLHRLLREELGFDGLAITDDMEMGAIARYQPWPEAAVAAFAAGADQLLICHDHAKQVEAIAAVTEALSSGRIPMARLEESLARIAAAKARIGPPPTARIEELAQAHAPTLAAYCARILEVSDPAGVLPLQGEAVDVFWPTMSVLTQVEEGSEAEDAVRATFGSRFAEVRLHPYDPREAASPAAWPGGPTVFFSANAHLYPAQAALIARVEAAASPFVLVTLRNPYDAALVGPEQAVVRVYGFLPNSLAAAMAAVAGP